MEVASRENSVSFTKQKFSFGSVQSHDPEVEGL